MNSSAEKILYRKAALIFEELGFLMPRSDNAEISQADRISAIVQFNGPFSGCLLVSLGPDMLALLSSNMLGEEGQSNTILERDSLGEIANVICGNALPAIYGFEPVFHLDAPLYWKTWTHSSTVPSIKRKPKCTSLLIPAMPQSRLLVADHASASQTASAGLSLSVLLHSP